MSRKYFGTDGIRGRVGAGVINPEFVLKLGWAAGKVFSQSGRRQTLLLVKIPAYQAICLNRRWRPVWSQRC